MTICSMMSRGLAAASWLRAVMDMVGLPSCREGRRASCVTVSGGYGTQLTTNPSLPRHSAAPQALRIIFRCFQGRDPDFKCGETLAQVMKFRLRCFLAGTGVGGQFGHGIQFLTPHQIESANGLVDARTGHRLELLAQAGDRRQSATGDARQVIEELWPFGHGVNPLVAFMEPLRPL